MEVRTNRIWIGKPEGEYKVSFTFTSAITATDLGSTVNAVLYLDLGQASSSIIEPSAALSAFMWTISSV